MEEVFSIPVIYIPPLFNMVHCENRNMNHCYFKKNVLRKRTGIGCLERAQRGYSCGLTATGDIRILSSGLHRSSIVNAWQSTLILSVLTAGIALLLRALGEWKCQWVVQTQMWGCNLSQFLAAVCLQISTTDGFVSIAPAWDSSRLLVLPWLGQVQS